MFKQTNAVLPLAGLSLTMLILMATTGCTQPMYVKNGATQEQFEADKLDCEQKVITMYGGYSQMGIGHALVARGDIQRCLQSKGYRLAQTQ